MLKLTLILALVCFVANAETKQFQVFGQANQSIAKRVDRRLGLATSWYFFKYENGKYDYSKVDPIIVARTAKEWPKDQLLVLDIENYSHDTAGKTQLRNAVRWLREGNPALRLGYYGEFPRQNYWGRVPYLKDLEAIKAGTEPKSFQVNKYQYDAAWKEDENRMWVADATDVVFPSCYTHYRVKGMAIDKDPSVHEWELYCGDQIKSAKRKNRPVVVYLWPRYYPSSVFPEKTLVEGYYFRKQLDLVYQLADGVVIYEEGLTAGDETGEWHQELMKFLDEKGLYKP